MHVPAEQRMVECIVGVILGGIAFAYQGIGGQVEEQPVAFTDDIAENLVQMASLDYVLDDKEGTGSDAAASGARRFLLRDRGPGKVDEVVLGGVHHGIIAGILFPDDRSLYDGVLLFSLVFPCVFILDVDGGPLLPSGYFPGNIRDSDKKIVVHPVASPLVVLPTKYRISFYSMKCNRKQEKTLQYMDLCFS